MKRGCWIAIAVAGALAGALHAQQENWSYETVAGSDGKPACVLVTPEEIIDDGQGDTRVKLFLDQQHLLVRTASNIDKEFGDIGLQVDDHGFIPADRIEHETNVVFDSQIEQITAQFIAGRTVRVQMRFWPTWPTTGVKTAEFSLIGFTRAHRGLAECQ